MKSLRLIPALLLTLLCSTQVLADGHKDKGWYVGIDDGHSSVDFSCNSYYDFTNNTSAVTVVVGPLNVTYNELGPDSNDPTNTITIFRQRVTTQMHNQNIVPKVKSANCDDSAIMMRLNAGYNWDENISFEGYYAFSTPLNMQANFGETITVTHSEARTGNTNMMITATATVDLDFQAQDEIKLNYIGLNLRSKFELANNVYLANKLGIHRWEVERDYKILMNGEDRPSHMLKYERVTNADGFGYLVGVSGLYRPSDSFDAHLGLDFLSGDYSNRYVYLGMSYRF